MNTIEVLQWYVLALHCGTGMLLIKNTNTKCFLFKRSNIIHLFVMFKKRPRFHSTVSRAAYLQHMTNIQHHYWCIYEKSNFRCTHRHRSLLKFSDFVMFDFRFKFTKLLPLVIRTCVPVHCESGNLTTWLFRRYP